MNKQVIKFYLMTQADLVRKSKRKMLELVCRGCRVRGKKETYLLKVNKKGNVCLVHFGSEGEASDGSEPSHPWLNVILKAEAEEKTVKVVDRKNSGESRERVMGVDFEHPLHGFPASKVQGRVGLETGA